MTHRVTVKTLKHDIVHLDLPHDCTVDECKEHLRSHRPDWRGGQLRLMSNGKQLTEGTLAAAGVFEYVEAAEDRFIVALFTATKPATRAAVAPPTLPAMAPSRKRSGGNESFLMACAQRLRDTNVSAEAKGRRQWASARPTQPEPPAPAEWLIAAPTPSEAAEAAAQAAEAAREAATHAAALEVVQAAEAKAQLMAMGFGEAESARALRAARGRCLRRRSRTTPSPISAPPLHLRCTSAAPPLHLCCPLCTTMALRMAASPRLSTRSLVARRRRRHRRRRLRRWLGCVGLGERCVRCGVACSGGARPRQEPCVAKGLRVVTRATPPMRSSRAASLPELTRARARGRRAPRRWRVT